MSLCSAARRRPTSSGPSVKRAMLVVDATAFAELLLRRAAAETVAGYLADHSEDLHAPHLVDVEVLSTLRRLAASGAASPERADQAVAAFLSISLERYPHTIL